MTNCYKLNPLSRVACPRLCVGTMGPRAGLYLPILLALFLAGCGSDPSENTAASQVTTEAVQPVNELDLAMQTVATLPVSKDGENASRALYYLNQWANQEEKTPLDFEKDPMLAHTPRSYENAPPLLDLGRPRYESPDLFYLQECHWFRDIARRVSPRPVSSNLDRWLKELEKKIGITSVDNLRGAERLFDWTICNIQLDPLPPPPKAAVAGVGENDPASLPAPLRGEKGPGYSQLPWQTLLFGHGDAQERSRVFMLLCRQAKIQAHILGVQDASGSGSVRPWLCGVVIKDQLYLFDAELGLAIPGPGGNGIATLEQVVSDPALVRALDLEGEATYPVTEAELKSVSVLIDAEPESLSLRMKMLEAALTGKQQVVLTCQPSMLEKDLRKCKHVSGVSIWRISLEAVVFQIAQGMLRQSNPAAMTEHQRVLFIFFPPHPLAEARHLQFEGQFDQQGEDDRPGSCQIYARLRLPDKAIESLETSSDARQILGVNDAMLSKDKKQRQTQLEDSMRIARLLKSHATYWIGLSHLDAGDYGAAAQWFKERTLEGNPDSPWRSGARYNLGRCYEEVGKWQAAREVYLADDSPQRHGNLLRARWLEEKSATAAERSVPSEKR